VHIQHDNLWARAAVDAEERTWLLEYLAFEEERYVQPRKGGKAHGRTKRIAPKVHHLYNVINDSLPSGLVPQVNRAATKAGFAVQLQDVRSRPFCVGASGAESFLRLSGGAGWLRAYQLRAAALALEGTRGVLWMPTGSGKTEVAVALGNVVPVNWLFLVHRKGLLGQAADRYELRTGDVAGRVGDGKWNVERFTVATFQTVARAVAKRDPRALALLRNAQGLVVDECHVLPANTFWSTVMEARDAYFRVGLSGTPIQRSDRRSMLAIAALGPVIYRLTARKLIDEGVLAEPIIRMLPVYQEVEAATWQGVYGKAIVRSTKRNKAVVEAVQRAEKPVLVFVKELKHGTELSARLTKAGLRVEFAHGKHSTTWRDNLIASLVRGDLDALVTTVIMQEGIDIPSLESVVVASGGKSAIAALQKIGRGMRSDDGRKETFEVWDFDDSGHTWLERHTKQRVKAYRDEGFNVEILT
jgi:superfamily II DNA or RNA helicase